MATYAGQVGGIAARSVSHWLASCELLRLTANAQIEYEIICVFYCKLRTNFAISHQ
jgi:hypothetical protein